VICVVGIVVIAVGIGVRGVVDVAGVAAVVVIRYISIVVVASCCYHYWW